MATDKTEIDTSTEQVDAVDTSATEQVSPLELSDEDFLKLAEPVAAPAKVEDKPAAETSPKADETPASVKADGAEGVVDGEASASTEQAPDADAKKVDTKAEKPAVEAKVEEKAAEAAVVDYKAEYERLTAPFKANGREVKIESVDDAIALMQMGANYNKKMAGLKPNLKLLKILESNGFLSEDKINFLIDLGKKDPAAINKLVKESGIDPMDLSAEKGEAYKPTTRKVDDREIELDTVLDELQSSSPTYARTLDVVSNKWDAASKQVVSQSPQLLKVIDDHVASGIYDQISTAVERERMLGRLNGLSDIEAYRQVGDAIQARGGFNHLGKPKAEEKPAATVVVVTPPPKKAEDDKLKDKRRAASSTQSAAPSTVAKDFNPLSLSDEEFSKLATPKFATR